MRFLAKLKMALRPAVVQTSGIRLADVKLIADYHHDGKITIQEIFCNPFTGLERPLGLQEVEARRISRQSAHENSKVLSHKLWPPLHPHPAGDTSGAYFCYRLSRPQGHTQKITASIPVAPM
jgi:hypothetical protein